MNRHPFSVALDLLKDGKRVAREGWNGKGMWLTHVDSDWSGTIGLRAQADFMPPEWKGNLPFIAMYTADKYLVPWLASQTDILANDWVVL